MQLLGSTPEARRQYKAAVIAEKQRLGAAFDLAAFNASWLAVDHGTPEGSRTPEAVTGEKVTAEKQPEAVTGSEVSRAQSLPAVPDSLPRVAGDDLLQGDVDDIPPEVRQVVADINGSIAAYKVDHDIRGPFAKEKNGILQLSAALMQACREIVRPSGILKKPPYQMLKNGAMVSRAYDRDRLMYFISVVAEICAREGLPFTRGLYEDLTGIASAFLSPSELRLTLNDADLREKVLKTEYKSSLTFAYGSDIGNLRNLNEREARPLVSDQGARRAVGASDLRKLPG